MGAAGLSLAKRLSKIIGTGDYVVADAVTNSLLNPRFAPVDASFGEPSHGIRVTHREYICDIATGPSTGVFYNNTFLVNPADPKTFPYLSCLAGPYEKFKMLGLVFEFVSSTSPYNSASSMGTVVCSAAYNSSAAPFLTKPAMENSAFAVSARMDKSIMYGVECSPGFAPLNSYFIRHSGITQPITMTDPISFQIATAPGTGIAANATIGELWVTYDIWLECPRQCVDTFGFYRLSRSGVTAAAPLGTTDTIRSGVGNLSYNSANTTTITLTSMVPGTVLSYAYTCSQASAGSIATNVPVLTGASGILAYNGQTQSYVESCHSAVSTTYAQVQGLCYVTAPTVTIQIQMGVITNAATMDLEIYSLGLHLAESLALPSSYNPSDTIKSIAVEGSEVDPHLTLPPDLPPLEPSTSPEDDGVVVLDRATYNRLLGVA